MNHFFGATYLSFQKRIHELLDLKYISQTSNGWGRCLQL